MGVVGLLITTDWGARMSHFSKRNNRRGNAILTWLTILPMLGFGSLSVDVGFQRMTEVQVQAACEAASASGSSYLDGTANGLQDAIDHSIRIGNLNMVQDGYTFTATNVELGLYEDGTWTGKDTNSDPAEVNAVRVTVTDHSTDSVLSRYVFGVTELGSRGAATSVQPRGGVGKYVDCYLPFAIPLCHFLDMEDGTNPAPIELDLGSINTVGWGMPNINPNTTDIKDLLANQCGNGTAATCDVLNADGTCGDGDLNTSVNASNGQNNAAVTHAIDIINGDEPGNPDDWPYNYFTDRPDRDGITANTTLLSGIDATRWGWNINGVVPIINHGCGEQFTGSKAIVGWTYAYVYDANDHGSDKNLWMQFDFINDYDIGYGQCTLDNGGGVGSGCEGNVTGTEPPIMVP